jgi:hypothetical protein
MNKTEEIIRYHEEAKHHFHRYAKSSGYLDWKNQPNPFRFYKGAKRVSLPLLKENVSPMTTEELRLETYILIKIPFFTPMKL